MKILITGGAGFVGSNLAIGIKRNNPSYYITCIDNLKRRGSELNVGRLSNENINFCHGDVRNIEDLNKYTDADLILECSAETAVTAGNDGSSLNIMNTNLYGTINCLELARKNMASLIFLSTSRVYPYKSINQLKYKENKTRFDLLNNQKIPGASILGISESFPLKGARSLYGGSKLASELIIEEYRETFGLKTVINRCGVLTGPWQMGNAEQGVIAHWIASYIFNKPLKYIGFGGNGKQVRDILHIGDLYNLIDYQIHNIDKCDGKQFNVGGGSDNSISLKELNDFVGKALNKQATVNRCYEDRFADIRIYITNNTYVTKVTGLKPEIDLNTILDDIISWIFEYKNELKSFMRS